MILVQFVVELSSPRWQTLSKFNNIVFGKVQLLPIMFESVRFRCLHYFVFQAVR